MGATNFDHEITRRIEDICNDRVHGATFLAGEALRALAPAAEALPSGEEYIPALKEMGQCLAHARPAMASIKNMVGRFIREMESGGEGFDPHALERELLDEIEEASRKAASSAAEYLYEGARVITCSHSSAVLRTFKAALASGKGFSVVAVESRANGLAHGRRLLEEVSALGIAAALVSDDAIYEGVSKSDMVMVGADKFLQYGGIVNGWPTLRLAERARGAIPFYVVCETFKLDDDPCAEEGFDLVPAFLIARVITDTRP